MCAERIHTLSMENVGDEPGAGVSEWRVELVCFWDYPSKKRRDREGRRP